MGILTVLADVLIFTKRTTGLRNWRGYAKDRKLKEGEVQLKNNPILGIILSICWGTRASDWVADFDSWFGKYLLNPICVQDALLNARKGKIKEGMILLSWCSLSFVSEKQAFVQHVMGKQEKDLCVSLTGPIRLHQWAWTWAEFWKTGRY